MVSNFSKTIDCSAYSVISEEKAALMSARIESTGNIRFSQSILNNSVYFSNVDLIQQDYEEFQKMVNSLVANDI